MNKIDLLDAGFVMSETDPKFIFEYNLGDPDENTGNQPALLLDCLIDRFCVTDGDIMFVYFDANTPEEAIEWAKKIIKFEPN